MTQATLVRPASAPPPVLVEPLTGPRLLAGPPVQFGPESYAEHRSRLGRRPIGGDWLLEVIERSGLRGRGGSWFPTHRKWRAVRRLTDLRGPSVMVVNASEGEPLSAKDCVLAEHRPHLLIDGALIAAEAIGADEIVIYLSRPSRGPTRSLKHALAERRGDGGRETPVRLVHTEHRYVAGESSAVVRRLSGGPSKPSFAPPHPSERGVMGRPTLVQNAETVAHAALIARFGKSWYRERGTDDAPGTTLLTISGNVVRPGVYEVDLGSELVSAAAAAGGVLSTPIGVLVGGYFGTWLDAGRGARARLTPAEVSIGCGIIGVLGADACGIVESARIVRYLARETAGQCGPCVHGLPAIAEAMSRLAAGHADRGDLHRIQCWADQVAGRGACHHPDGAIHNVRSALEVFATDVERHLAGRACAGKSSAPLPPPPRRRRGWR